MCEISSKLTVKTPKQRHWRHFGVFIVDFEHISHLCSGVSIANFEQVNAGWDRNVESCSSTTKNIICPISQYLLLPNLVGW